MNGVLVTPNPEPSRFGLKILLSIIDLASAWRVNELCFYVFYSVKHIALSYTWHPYSWWRHQMETFSASLAICAGNSPVPGEFPTQRPVTRSFDVFFDLRLNKRLNKQSWGWWLQTLSRPLWRHRNVHCVSRCIIDGNVSIVSLNDVCNMYPLSTCAFIKVLPSCDWSKMTQ